MNLILYKNFKFLSNKQEQRDKLRERDDTTNTINSCVSALAINGFLYRLEVEVILNLVEQRLYAT